VVQVDLPESEKVVILPVDRERSYISAQILADQPETLFFYIVIDCCETEVPRSELEKEEYGTNEDGYTETCSLQLMNLSAPVQTWRDLSGRLIEVTYDPGKTHPILPDSPGSFYFESQHHVPNGNRVRFGTRRGCAFDLEWRFTATLTAEDPGVPVVVTTRLVLRQIEVLLPEGGYDAGMARKLALRFAAPSDLGEPEQVGAWCVLPLLIPAEPAVPTDCGGTT
jgi:hypothetical protein